MAIMKFMGDYYSSKGRTEVDVVHFLLQVAHKHELLRDEIYCQLIKQTTSNKSERAESCARGWRLLVICTAFIKPSEVFERYLRSYLQTNAFTPQREFRDQGLICLRNLKQTMRHGGRRELPDVTELAAVIGGKYTKIQKLYLPGERTKSIKINAVTVVADVVRQMCEKMEVEHVDEYGLYIQATGAPFATLLQASDYILDITTIYERRSVPYHLYFRKVLWFAPPREKDNVAFITMMFDQVSPDMVNGNMLAMADMTSEFINGDFSTLQCLYHVATHPTPGADELVLTYRRHMPLSVLRVQSETEWARSLLEKFVPVSKLNPIQAKKLFLQLLAKLPLFGSRFFNLESVSDSRLKGPSLLAINRRGIQFLHPETRAMLLSYGFNEIVSTRRLGSRATGKHFVDLKLGNLMVQRVTRCETMQGMEITGIISTYIRLQAEEAQPAASVGVYSP